LTLSRQEISDRLEIQDLLTAYSHAVDRRRWDDLDGLFTSDAVIDYHATGSIKGSLADLKDHLLQVMPMMLSYQHLVGTTRLTLLGDEAEGRSVCFNPMVIDGGEDRPPRVFFCGLWYRDRFIRQSDGWRFARRAQELSYFYDFPGGSPPGASPFGFPA
jgi:hypothetical protein